MQVFQTLENQHGRNHHRTERSDKGNPRVQRLVRIDIVFTVIERIKTAVILRLQLLRIKFGLIVNLCIVRHFSGIFDFFSLRQTLEKQAVLFFIGLFLLLDAFERTFRPSIVI